MEASLSGRLADVVARISKGRRGLVQFMYRSLWHLVVVYSAIVLGLIVLVQPVKNYTWNAVVREGDTALAKRQFELARIEYTKLKLIRNGNVEPNRLIERVGTAEKDITSLREFYQTRGETEMLQLLDQATKQYDAPESATNACQDLARKEELDLALLCIQKTTITWPTYRDGWVSLELIARMLERADVAAEAHQKALEIDPNLL